MSMPQLPEPKPAGYHAVLLALCASVALAACSAPALSDPKPSVQEVPFLGKQLTQEQIADWRAGVNIRRTQLEADLAQQKRDCYQQFFVNACLHKSQNAYRQQDAILRKQEIELNRQGRVLKELDRQLRLQEKAAAAQ